MTQRDNPEADMVYLIGCPGMPGPVKVGRTIQRRLVRRVSELRGRHTGSGRVLMPEGVDVPGLQMLISRPGSSLVEAHVKRQLSDRRVIGEWFDLGDAPVPVFLSAVALATADPSTRRIVGRIAPDLRKVRLAANRGRFLI